MFTTPADLLQLAASLDSNSEHPVAHTLVEYWHQELPTSTLLAVSRFEAIPGHGVEGIVRDEIYYVGNLRLAEENRVCKPDIEELLERLEKEGKTTVILSNT